MLKALILSCLLFLSSLSNAAHLGPKRAEDCTGVIQFAQIVVYYEEAGLPLKEFQDALQAQLQGQMSQERIDFLKRMAKELYEDSDPERVVNKYLKHCLGHGNEVET